MESSGLKRCCGCKETLPSSSFRRNRTRTDGLQGLCKICQKEDGARRSKARKDKYGTCHTPSKIRELYQCSFEEYVARMTTSDKCEACGSDDRLQYDHDHNTGAFRGVLCWACNVGIGKLGDDLEGLERALKYLRRHYA